METDCPCGSGAAYAACCGPLHQGGAVASTAEQLMRSRYSASAVGDAGYLLVTWHPSTRPESLELDPALQWRRLTISGLSGGGEADAAGTVSFVAHCWDPVAREYRSQREDSRFVREAEGWLYVEAVS